MDSKPSPLTLAPLSPPVHRVVNLIVVHCSATPSGLPMAVGTVGAAGFQNPAQVIDAWHAERGFRRGAAARAAFNPSLGSIGYHFVIDLTGEVFTGRDVEEIGAHAKDHNAHSIGICMVGGVEPTQAQFTPEQWKSLQSVVLWQAHRYNIPLMAPRRNGDKVFGGVCGHRDLSPDLNHNGVITPTEWLKTCPGFEVSSWLANGMQPLLGHIWREVVLGEQA